MKREIATIIISTIFLSVAIILLPNQFLFSKIVQNSIWTEYFPLPFGAGWFITFISLIPAIWLATSTSNALKGGIMAVLTSVMVAVPVSVAMVGGSLTPNNLLNQYIWVGIICLPLYILHLSLRCVFSLLKHQWLTNRSKPTPKSGAV